jgi:hypothetical protein
MASTVLRTWEGASARVMGCPSRQGSTHGMCQACGAPPATICEKSRSGFGSRPGASATVTRPSRFTGTVREAHSVRASCALRSPAWEVRATMITDAGALSLTGHACPAGREPSNSCASDDSPAPPCAPTHQSAAGQPIVRRGSRSAESGAGTPDWGAAGRSGVRGPDGMDDAGTCAAGGRAIHGCCPSGIDPPFYRLPVSPQLSASRAILGRTRPMPHHDERSAVTRDPTPRRANRASTCKRSVYVHTLAL